MYLVDEIVEAAFSCADSDGTVVTCIGTVADGQPINTATSGVKSFSVTATDNDGATTTDSVSYRVNARPTVGITRAAAGAVYLIGEVVEADFSCADSDGTVASCIGTVADGQPINTATSGVKMFSVTATDDDGATATKTVSYRVAMATGLCRGTALRAVGLDPATANAPESPCIAQAKSASSAGQSSGGLLGNALSSSVLSANTARDNVSRSADAHVADVKVNALVVAIHVRGVHSEVSSKLSTCSSATAQGKSSVSSLSVGGLAIAVTDQPMTVPLLVGAIHLNQTVRTGNTITQTAVFIDLPGTALDVVLGQSKAGAVCD